MTAPSGGDGEFAREANGRDLIALSDGKIFSINVGRQLLIYILNTAHRAAVQEKAAALELAYSRSVAKIIEDVDARVKAEVEKARGEFKALMIHMGHLKPKGTEERLQEQVRAAVREFAQKAENNLEWEGDRAIVRKMAEDI